MNFLELESEYAEVLLPEAFRWAVAKSKEAELLVYQVLTKCTTICEDVSIELEKDDVICRFLKSWKEQGHLSEKALKYEEQAEKNVLSCTFDIYMIRDDLESFVSDVFGTINYSVIEGALDPSNIEISEDRMNHLDKAIQKVKKPAEAKTAISVKKDN
ncbi:MAG: hypothetical protein PUC82_04040 [bacterium]|nr:hypothetical protein [bacterium]